jgi:hypothetical protein
MICCAVCLVGFMVESPAQSGRMRTLIHPGPTKGVHVKQKTIKQIQRSVCWHRLEKLHHCMPRQYKNPNHLYFHLKRQPTDG